MWWNFPFLTRGSRTWNQVEIKENGKWVQTQQLGVWRELTTIPVLYSGRKCFLWNAKLPSSFQQMRLAGFLFKRKFALTPVISCRESPGAAGVRLFSLSQSCGPPEAVTCPPIWKQWTGERSGGHPLHVISS